MKYMQATFTKRQTAQSVPREEMYNNILVLKITKNLAISIDRISIDSANNRKVISISRPDSIIVHSRERYDRFEYLLEKYRRPYHQL